MIFISYRKSDSQDFVGHLARELKRHFGAERVFVDVRDLEPGREWPQDLCKAVLECDVLLAVIGATWLKAQDQYGRRRLDNKKDWVRLEICTALENGKVVIPVLLGGATMPAKQGLPPCPLQRLPSLQSLTLRTDGDFELDLARLVEALSPRLTPRYVDPGDPLPQLLREATQTASERFVSQLSELDIFRREVYTERHEARLHINRFLDSEAPAMLLLGASGTGKTCVVAALVDDWLKEAPWNRVALPLPASNLPPSAEGIESAVTKHLGLAPPISKSASEMDRRIQQALPGLRILVILDALDRHPDCVAAIKGVQQLAEIFRGTRSFRLLVTCTLTVVESCVHAMVPFADKLFYQASRSGVTAHELGPPGVVLGPLEVGELEEAYQKYQKSPGTSPTTSFDSLSEKARQVLASPVLLRLAMEVYDGKPIPPDIFSGVMLQEYARQRIFQLPRCADFAAALVDLMLARRERSVRLDVLFENPRLRPAVLDESEDSPYVQLRNAHLLNAATRFTFQSLPLPPEKFVEFTYERLLEYLLMWRLSARHTDYHPLISDALELSRSFVPMRGAVLQMLFHIARARVYQPLATLLRRPVDDELKALLRDLMIDLFEMDSPGGQAAGVTEIVHALAAIPPLSEEAPEAAPLRTIAEVVSRAGEALFIRGRWDRALAAIEAVAHLPGLDRLTALGQRNRLVLLCKNSDEWPEARQHSDHCLGGLAADDPPDLWARVYVNRGSVLYDMGERDDAASAFRQAARYAGLGGSAEELAAANNLGIYHHYHDELDEADRILRAGLTAADDRPLLAAYLETNLGLVFLTRSLGDRSKLDDAGKIFQRVLEHFTKLGHFQGISYALTNCGIVELERGHFDQARDHFEETIALARQIGEKWSAYGAMANLALWHLAQSPADPLEAWHLAAEVRVKADDNNDPKGVADSALIAGRAALDLASGGASRSVWLARAQEMLATAQETFRSLGQRLGQAQACFGLGEVLTLQGDRDGAGVFERAGRDALGRTELPGLAARLRPLPWHMLLLMELF